MVRPATAPTRRGTLRCMAITCLFLLLTMAAVVLLSWLLIKPKPISYTVEQAAVRGLAISGNDTLNATFTLLLRLKNPNRRISLNYRSFDVSVWFGDQMVAFDEVGAFRQPRRNATNVEVTAAARAAPLMKAAAEELMRQRRAGMVEVDVRVRAGVRLKVSAAESRVYRLKAVCSPVVVPVDPKGWFERRSCDVDL